MAVPDAVRAPRAVPGRQAVGWFGLAVLVLVSLFAYVDRQVFILLAEPIKRSLSLSDLQLGSLQGLGIGLFAAVAAVPIGWLADRADRWLVLAAAVSVWSLAVAACGLATTYAGLFAASGCVGAGEAALTPIAYALIPSLFTERLRQVANAVFIAASQLGVGLAQALCGLLIAAATRADAANDGSAGEVWRTAFLAAALPMPVFVVLILLARAFSGRDHARGPAPRDAGREGGLAAFVRANARTVLGFNAGIALAAFGFASIINWVPPIVARLYGESPADAARATGTATLLATLAGLALGTVGYQALRRRVGPTLPIVALWTSSLFAAATTAALLLTDGALGIYVLQGVQFALIMGAFMVYPTALQDISPAPLRGRLIALSGLVRLAGVTLSPLAVGALSDLLGDRKDGLLLAAVSAATAAFLGAAAALRWAASAYRTTAEAAAIA